MMDKKLTYPVVFSTLHKEVMATLAKLNREAIEMLDMSDVGNTVGAAIAQHFQNQEEDIEDFLTGLRHGISIIDGTHDNPTKKP